MKEKSNLTLLKGIAIIIVFSIGVFSCINVVIQGESDLTGANGDMTAISMTCVGDFELQVYLLGSVHILRVSPILSEAYERSRSTLGYLAYSMTASLRQSIENLMNCR